MSCFRRLCCGGSSGKGKKKEDITVIVVGVDNAGKSTIVSTLRRGHSRLVCATQGWRLPSPSSSPHTHPQRTRARAMSVAAASAAAARADGTAPKVLKGKPSARFSANADIAFQPGDVEVDPDLDLGAAPAAAPAPAPIAEDAGAEATAAGADTEAGADGDDAEAAGAPSDDAEAAGAEAGEAGATGDAPATDGAADTAAAEPAPEPAPAEAPAPAPSPEPTPAPEPAPAPEAAPEPAPVPEAAPEPEPEPAAPEVDADGYAVPTASPEPSPKRPAPVVPSEPQTRARGQVLSPKSSMRVPGSPARHGLGRGVSLNLDGAGGGGGESSGTRPLHRVHSSRRSMSPPRPRQHDDGATLACGAVLDGTALPQIVLDAGMNPASLPRHVLLLLGTGHPPEYSGQQASVMHKLCRSGVLAAAAHTDAVLVGRCGRFDLLSVCCSKATLNAGRRRKSGKRSARADAPPVDSVCVMSHYEESEPVSVSAKVYVDDDEMAAAKCRVALAAQLSGQQAVSGDYVEMGRGPPGRVVVIVGGGGARVQAAAQMCVSAGWPIVVLGVASGATGGGPLPLTGIAADDVHVFEAEQPATHLGTLIHMLLITSPATRKVGSRA